MQASLLLGGLVIAVTVITHTIGLVALSHAMKGIVRWFRLHRRGFGKMVAKTTSVRPRRTARWSSGAAPPAPCSDAEGTVMPWAWPGNA